MPDSELVARELLRAIRGRRSQVAFVCRLGFRSNVCTDWERGVRFPRVSEALRTAEVAGIDVSAALRSFLPAAHGVFVEHGPAAWLRAVAGSTSQRAIAERTGFSRHRIGRWLRGDAEPRLPDWLAVVDATTGRMPDLVGALVPIESVPSVTARARALRRAARLVYEHPRSPLVLALVDADPGIEESRLAAVLGAEIAPTVAAMVDAGLLARRRGLRVRETPSSVVEGTRAERQQIRRHWTSVALERLERSGERDVVGFNVFAVSEAARQAIEARYRDFYREVRAIVAASGPSEVAGLLLVHLVAFDGPDPRPD